MLDELDTVGAGLLDDVLVLGLVLLCALEVDGVVGGVISIPIAPSLQPRLLTPLCPDIHILNFQQLLRCSEHNTKLIPFNPWCIWSTLY